MQRRQGRQPRSPNVAYRQRMGARLREVREARGVSQEDLANLTDMSRRYVGAIERGEVSPTVDRVVLLAGGLGVEPAELLPPMAPKAL